MVHTILHGNEYRLVCLWLVCGCIQRSAGILIGRRGSWMRRATREPKRAALLLCWPGRVSRNTTRRSAAFVLCGSRLLFSGRPALLLLLLLSSLLLLLYGVWNTSASSRDGQSPSCSPQSRTQRALARCQTLWKEGLDCGI